MMMRIFIVLLASVLAILSSAVPVAENASVRFGVHALGNTHATTPHLSLPNAVRIAQLKRRRRNSK